MKLKEHAAQVVLITLAILAAFAIMAVSREYRRKKQHAAADRRTQQAVDAAIANGANVVTDAQSDADDE